MPPSVRMLRYTQREFNFAGGLNQVTPATELADHELTVCRNLWYPGGTLTKRPGFYKIPQSPNNFVSAVGTVLFTLGYDPLADDYLIGTIGDSKIWAIKTGAVTAFTGITDPPTWLLALGGSIYLGFAGATGVRTRSANTISGAIANSPASLCGEWHKSRIFVGSNVVGGRLAFSNPNAPGTWSVADTIDVSIQNREYIRALVSTGDLLLIFTDYSTYSLYVQGDSPANWVVRKIGSVGAAGKSAVCYYNGTVYFISRDGIYKTNGVSFSKISDKLWKPEDPKFSFGSGASFNSSNWRVTRLFDHLIFTAITWDVTDTKTGYTFVYNMDTNAWSQWLFLDNFGFDDFYVNMNANPYYNGVQALATKGANLYYALSGEWGNYDAQIALGFNPYADGATYNTPGVGAAYTATLQSKSWGSFMDWYWRIKWASLEYVSRVSPQFNMVADGVNQAAVSPGFSTLVKAYKMPGAGRVRTFAIRGVHSATSPFEFYRGNYHYHLKTHVSASGTP